MIFDWDGTIAMSLHLWLSGFREGLREQGFFFSDTVIIKDFFYEHDKARIKYPDIDVIRLASYANIYTRKHLGELELYKHAEKMLSIIKSRGMKIALVSSSSRQLLESGLETHDLTHYFDVIITADDTTEHKPSPEGFNRAIKHLGAAREETLIIGDARTDILAGKASSIKTCLFLPEENNPFYDFDELRKIGADFEISDLSELEHILVN